MKRLLVLAYGVAAYLMFFATFLYLIGFVGNLFVPKSLDGPAEGPLSTALIINALLIVLFGVQHSVMARPTFKRWWTRFVPQPIERSTYVLATNLVLILLFWQWRPMGGVVWNVEDPVGRAVLYSLFAGGWVLIFVATCLINHFDLFGLRQVWLYFRGKPYTHLDFATPGPYQIVRHPLYVGWLMAFWATPTMSMAHLIFALGNTACILIAIPFEERNLAQFHGERYQQYRRRVPMLIPWLGRKPSTPKAKGTSPGAA